MKLIIINGPTGAGKSTLAKKLKDEYPMSFFIHFDGLRRMIGNYHDHREESRVFTFEITFSIMHTAFKQGRDVIIDKIMYDRIESAFKKRTIDMLYDLAKEYDAEVHELILWADKETIMKRLDERGHIQGGFLTKEKAEEFWGEMNKYKDIQSTAKVVDTTDLDAEKVFKKACQLIEIV